MREVGFGNGLHQARIEAEGVKGGICFFAIAGHFDRRGVIGVQFPLHGDDVFSGAMLDEGVLVCSREPPSLQDFSAAGKTSDGKSKKMFSPHFLASNQFQSTILWPSWAALNMPAPTRVTTREKGKQLTDALPKDDVELRLEKALFGDNAGFLESLKRNQVEEERSLARRESNEEKDSVEDEGSDGTADEDVSRIWHLSFFH